MKSKKSLNYEEDLIESLKDPEEAEAYLSAAVEEGDVEVFLLALHHVVQARGGMTKVAEKSNKSRSSLYRALSNKGNPYLKSVFDILGAVGMHLSIAKDTNNLRPHRT